MKNNTKEYWDAVYQKGEGKYNTLLQDGISSLKNLGLIQGNVVDLGCGKGELVKTLSDFGFNAVGYDISPVAIEKGKQEFKEVADKLFVGDVNDIPENTDTVILHMVYAFIEDKKEFLNTIKNKLSHNGTLIISTPVRTPMNTVYIARPEISVIEDEIQIIKDIFSDTISILRGRYPVGDFMFVVSKKV